MFYKAKKAHAILGVPVSSSSLIAVSEVRNCRCDLPEKTTRDKANKFCSFCGKRIWEKIEKPVPEWKVKDRHLYAKGEAGNKEECLMLAYSDEVTLYQPGNTLEFPRIFQIVAGAHHTATVPDSRTDADDHVSRCSALPTDLTEIKEKVERILKSHGILPSSHRPFGIYAILERNALASEPRC